MCIRDRAHRIAATAARSREHPYEECRMIAQVALALSLTAPPDNWFGSDKLKHFFIAAFTQTVAYSALQAARVDHDQALVGAWAVTAAVSVGKELRDRRSYGLFSCLLYTSDAADERSSVDLGGR